MNHHPSAAQRLAFEAFQALQRTHYTAYAVAHLDPEDADRAVHDAFAAIFTAWRDIITDHAPAQRAWEHLRTQVHRRARPDSPAPPSDLQDIRTLAALGYNAQASAVLMGLSPGRVRFFQRGADTD
ncbi:hypothetical protein OHA84_35290 [Streptomyces sp. NBC_00513]|uniref:hypothetical protein n=1 Tax=unclassified Streptomyces TaxID=2593676 RepID=UPI0022577B53|nr:hypothetical protein [Streptomyces sp. NBC_00424]MCX5071218.1 hypothetical protein [Streptomyces sp. NBC_00424]WUD45365.1 hypothetical protein OHA84_35290 [Streptomyces sp. NBC_00513]